MPGKTLRTSFHPTGKHVPRTSRAQNQVHLDSQRFTGDSQPWNSSWKCQHKNKTGKKIFAFQGYLTNTEIQ